MHRYLLLWLGVCVLLLGCGLQSEDTVEAPVDASGAPAGGPDDSASAASRPGESAPVVLEGGVAQLSANNTRIQFVGTHVGDRPDPRTGGFSALAGKLEFDSEGKTLQAINLEVETGSLWTNIPQLTAHLKSPDFFDALQYPKLTFSSTAIAPSEGEANRYQVTGNLTLLAATKEIQFPATVVVSRNEVAVRSEFTLDRTEFGMNYGLDRVEKQISITVVVGEPAGEGPPTAAMAGALPGRGEFDPAALFKQRDTDGDGQLTGEEISERMRENLEAIDKNGDGAVSSEEFEARFREMSRGPGGTPAPPPANENPAPKPGEEASPPG